MRAWIPTLALPFAPLLSGCAEEAEAGTPNREPLDVVSGVALDQPIVAEERGEPEMLAAIGYDGDDDPATSGGAKATGDDAIQDLKSNVLGVEVTGIDDLGRDLEVEDGVIAIAWRDLSLEGEEMEDILDKLLYPEQYDEDEFEFPERIMKLDGKEIAIVGYQIPLEWEGTKVPEFMLVGDLLGCCFGGAPMPDQWIDVIMDGEGADYFPYIPVVVRGTLRIEGIEDEAGYAAGCYYLDAVSVKKEL